MSDAERRACWIGAILIGFATILMVWNDTGVKRRSRRSGDEPVEVLAEELKEAWAEHHTP